MTRSLVITLLIFFKLLFIFTDLGFSTKAILFILSVVYLRSVIHMYNYSPFMVDYLPSPLC